LAEEVKIAAKAPTSTVAANQMKYATNNRRWTPSPNWSGLIRNQTTSNGQIAESPSHAVMTAIKMRRFRRASIWDLDPSPGVEVCM